jgi:aminopeptidase N
MREATTAVVRREDYAAPAYFIRAAELSFDLDPAKTIVASRLTIERNPAGPRQPLRLHGEGLTLLRVKHSMPHGTFEKWLDSNLHAVQFSTRQARYLMRLAVKFIERTKARVPDLLALPGDQLSLDLADNAAGKALAAKPAGGGGP